MNLNKKFLWSSNLEFVLDPDSWTISKKILYRSYGDTREFRKNIFSYLSESIFDPEILETIDAIFCIPETQNLVFHFWEDSKTHRLKFYISLYELPFIVSLEILSEIKKILWIHQYFLEKNFKAFDCIGFDIQKNSIVLKVYELVSFQKEYEKFLPEYIDSKNIKEVWFLKSNERRKIFFRLQNHLDIRVLGAISDSLHPFYIFLWDMYQIQEKITYFCYEQGNKEIYFI